jgi:hypothetical protein
MIEYKNRYGDIYNFTKDSDGNILWTGNFEYVRRGYPNDYTKAYDTYCKDHIEGYYNGIRLTIEEFQNQVHEYDDDKKDYVLGRKYVQLVESVMDKIDFIDPSGGPFIGVGADMGRFSETFEDMIVEDIIKIENGYRLIIKNSIFVKN